MATNKPVGDNTRKGAVKKRSQLATNRRAQREVSRLRADLPMRTATSAEGFCQIRSRSPKKPASPDGDRRGSGPEDLKHLQTASRIQPRLDFIPAPTSPALRQGIPPERAGNMRRSPSCRVRCADNRYR
jgi:hypothetical protein